MRDGRPGVEEGWRGAVQWLLFEDPLQWLQVAAALLIGWVLGRLM